MWPPVTSYPSYGCFFSFYILLIWPDSVGNLVKDAFAEFIRLVDPDIITGYNIVNFDSPYIINRAEKLKCNDFPFLGRLRNNRTKIRDARFSSKQMGTREYKEINLEGRVHLGMIYYHSKVCLAIIGGSTLD